LPQTNESFFAGGDDRRGVAPLTAPVAEFVRIPASSLWRAAHLPSIERKPTCYPKTSRIEPGLLVGLVPMQVAPLTTDGTGSGIRENSGVFCVWGGPFAEHRARADLLPENVPI
jgi:hypothetical protein